MAELRGTFAARVLPGIGLAALWAAIALGFETFVVDYLKAAGSNGGPLAPRGGWDLWLWPTTLAGCALFLALAAFFVRASARSGIPRWLIVGSMAAGLVGFWGWALLYGRDLAILSPAMPYEFFVRNAAPLSLSSSIGIVIGIAVGLMLVPRRRRSASEAAQSDSAVGV